MSAPDDDDPLDVIRGRGMPGPGPLGAPKRQAQPAAAPTWRPHADPRFEVDGKGRLRTRIDLHGGPLR
jgi:hypothetical protein